ncbi:MAG: PspC domain-containing protein [Acidimicrobiales bacterium]
MDATSGLGSPPSAPTPSPPDGRAGPRRLRRRPDDGHVAGVCAGVAEYFNVDPLLVRIAAVVLLFSGPGAFAYILAWVFVPAEPGLARYGEQPPIDYKDRATQIFGIVLLGLGVSVMWGNWWSPLHGWLFPLGLMALGGWLLLRPDREDHPAAPMSPAADTAAWSWPPVSTPAPAGDTDVSEPGEMLDGDGDANTDADPDLDATGTDVDTDGEPDPTTVRPTADPGAGGTGWGAPPPPGAPWDVPPSPVPDDAVTRVQGQDHRHRHHRHRHLVGPGVFGVLLIWTGLAWLTGVGLTTGLAVGLVILGLGFVLGSFVGGSRALIFPAVVVAIALAITAFIDIPFSGPIGEQHWSPTSRAELNQVDTYDVSMGEGTLDLSELPLLMNETNVRATVGLGHLVVLVPEGQELSVNTEVGAGEVRVFGEEQNGVGFETHDGFPGAGGPLILDLEVGMGQVEVHRVDSEVERERPDGPSTTSTTQPLG